MGLSTCLLCLILWVEILTAPWIIFIVVGQKKMLHFDFLSFSWFWRFNEKRYYWKMNIVSDSLIFHCPVLKKEENNKIRIYPSSFETICSAQLLSFHWLCWTGLLGEMRSEMRVCACVCQQDKAAHLSVWALGSGPEPERKPETWGWS